MRLRRYPDQELPAVRAVRERGRRRLGVGIMSEITSCTSPRIPENASSAVAASQLSEGNSAQSPTCSPSSGDQVTRYV